MKKKDLVSLFNIINQINETQVRFLKLDKPILFSNKFSYALAKINYQIQYEISILSDIQMKNNEVRKDYLTEVNQICSKYNCKPEINGWKYPEDSKIQVKIQKELKDLESKYKDDLILYDNKMQEYNQLLEEDIQITLYKITDITIIPDSVTPEQMNVFMLCGIID
jgi:hypothetical protein